VVSGGVPAVTEEGRTNHLVPGITALEAATYQRDTVTVTALIVPDRIDHGPLVLDPRRHPETAAPWTVEPRAVRLRGPSCVARC
jgi:hypothetical protein